MGLSGREYRKSASAIPLNLGMRGTGRTPKTGEGVSAPEKAENRRLSGPLYAEKDGTSSRLAAAGDFGLGRIRKKMKEEGRERIGKANGVEGAYRSSSMAERFG